MPLNAQTKVLFFDIFGTTVQWRTSVTKALQEASAKALSETSLPGDVRAQASAMTDDDWRCMVEDWRAAYSRFTRSYDPAQSRGRSFVSIDQHHYDALVEILCQRQLEGLFPEAQLRALVLSWHGLDPWDDTVPGLALLGRQFRTAALSNANVSLLEDLVRHGSLPFTDLVSAETFAAYKPSPRVYLGAAGKLGFQPGECALVAAHLDDLRGAKECGFGTIYVERVGEEKLKLEDAVEEEYVDLSVEFGSGGFVEIARLLGVHE
ncbi:hypothetical protein AOCH_007465 [Aspergillus ochraceoroseus]|nr:hypothetical protein AOCH_007465 [Aspergillus ochraceoroseus]